MEKTKWLLDTDIGCDNDDCMALGWLLAQSDVDLLGVTTVCEDSTRRALLADVMCRLAGKTVPVCPGAQRPLIGKPWDGALVEEEAALVDQYPHAESVPQNQAVLFLKETIEAHPHEVVLAAIGALTNVALLFATYPHIPGLLKSLVVMGGRYFETEACDVRKWGFIECNIVHDPYAAAIVFAADVPSRLVVGVETSCQLKIPGAQAAEAIAPIPFMRPIASVIKTWSNAWFHDALAVWAWAHQDKVGWTRGDIHVVLDNPEQLGTTVFVPSENSPTRLLTGLDPEVFYRGYAESMNIHW